MSDLINYLRAIVVEEGKIAGIIQRILVSLFRYGNPWEQVESRRMDWCKEADVKVFSHAKKADVLYFVGCTPSYDARAQGIARSITYILKKAKIDFAVLGTEEKCCGDPAKRLGEEGLFEHLKKENISLFKKYRFKKIITSSPHCFTVLTKHYPELTEKIEVQHYTQFLAELIDENKFSFKNNEELRVTYHDPCFLSKHNKITEEPRKIIESIPKIELVEMKRVRENSFCCGGGGGRIWMEEPLQERPSIKRGLEALSTNPDIVAVACPFCLIMLNDAISFLNKKENVTVKDISEIIASRLTA